MKTLEELTATHLRKEALGQEGHGRPSSEGTVERQMVRRLLLKKSSKPEVPSGDAVALASAADSLASHSAELGRQLARARLAVLKKKPADGEGASLSELMAD